MSCSTHRLPHRPLSSSSCRESRHGWDPEAVGQFFLPSRSFDPVCCAASQNLSSHLGPGPCSPRHSPSWAASSPLSPVHRPPPGVLVSSRFLVLPSLGRSLQSALDVSPEHVLSERSVLQVACRLVRTQKSLSCCVREGASDPSLAGSSVIDTSGPHLPPPHTRGWLTDMAGG